MASSCVRRGLDWILGEISVLIEWSVESWLDERGHSLVLLSNPGLVTEIDLESSEHGTLLQK